MWFGKKILMSRGYFRELLHQFKVLFGQSTRIRVIQICLIDFFSCFSYFPLVIWIPELLHRRDIYLEHVGRNQSVSLCYASHHLKSEDSEHILPENCIQEITTDVYVGTLIICASVVPAVIVMYFALLYIPKKILIGLATLAITFVKGNTITLVMFCLFAASSTIIETIIFVITVEMLPTTISGTALACIVTSGRIGAVISNIIIGHLVDTQCDITFYSMAASFIFGGIICLTLPQMHKTSHPISFSGPAPHVQDKQAKDSHHEMTKAESSNSTSNTIVQENQ